MKEVIKAERAKLCCIALLMLVFGILFVALPTASYSVLVNVLGWLLVIVGVALVIVYFMTPLKHVTSVNFVNGMLLFLLGILFLTVPGIYIALIGFALAFSGLQYLGTGINACRAGAKGYWQDIVNGLIQFVFGLVLVILRYSSVAQKAIMIYMGIVLIVYSLFMLCGLLTLRKIQKSVENN